MMFGVPDSTFAYDVFANIITALCLGAVLAAGRVSVRLSVFHTVYVSKRLKISSDFFFDQIAPSF